MRYRTLITRLIVSAAVFAQGVALSAQPWAGAPAFRSGMNDLEIRPLQNARLSAMHRLISTPAAIVPLQLAGLPGSDAAPGKRIFLTVREDVYQNGRLFIAAGARAKGLIRAIRYQENTLYLGLELQTVQTVDGPLVALAAEPVALTVQLDDKQAPHWPFNATFAQDQRLAQFDKPVLVNK